MTARRTANFMHLNGPYDGEALPVEVDADGVPVEHYFFIDMTDVDMSRNATTEIQADEVQVLYERDTQLGDEGLEYVFLFRGVTILRDSKAA